MKTVKKLYHIFDREELSFLKSQFSSHFFANTTELIYAKHIPMAVFILLRGTFTIKKSKNQVDISDQGVMIGFKEVVDKVSFPYTLSISADSEILIIGRSSLLEYLDLEHLDCPLSRHMA